METLIRLSNLEVNTLLPAHEAMRSGGDVAIEVKRQRDRSMKIEKEVLYSARSEWNVLNGIADEVVRRLLVGRSDEASFTEVSTVHSYIEKLIY